jgi:hypothetical protein
MMAHRGEDCHDLWYEQVTQQHHTDLTDYLKKRAIKSIIYFSHIAEKTGRAKCEYFESFNENLNSAWNHLQQKVVLS